MRREKSWGDFHLFNDRTPEGLACVLVALARAPGTPSLVTPTTRLAPSAA